MFRFKPKKDPSIIETTNKEEIKQLSFFKKLVKLTVEPDSPYLLRTEKKLNRKLMMKNKKAKNYREPLVFKENNNNNSTTENNPEEIVDLLNKFNQINQKVNEYKAAEIKRLQNNPTIFKINWKE